MIKEKKETELKENIYNQIKKFNQGCLIDNASEFFTNLGYNSDKDFRTANHSPAEFIEHYNISQINKEKAKINDWRYIDIIFQITYEDIAKQYSLFNKEGKFDQTIIESYLFMFIELKNNHYSRTDLANITREVNKLFLMPVFILFKYDNKLTFSIINRRLNKKDKEKDVLLKVTLIKDINIENPHRAHIEILNDLALENLQSKHSINNFVELHDAWQKTLDLKELNKKFFKEIANWYFWAIKKVTFPDDEIKDKDTRNATNIIRFLTRIIFVWFLKEKGLVPDELFDESKLKKIIKFIDPKKSSYYKAILQNLFFATLNTEQKRRKFRSKNEKGLDAHYFIHNLFRYEDEFYNSKEVLEKYFMQIPFLNGGLFECLDKENEIDGKIKSTRIDGFSDRKDNKLVFPDKLFFTSSEQIIDLNDVYGTTNKIYKVCGLINILNKYKFTITENTPIEEEIALDPELLGKVFENLLANYNPETKITARKQFGSFYTPREIVDYMVDESLIELLKLNKDVSNLKNNLNNNLDEKLRDLISYKETPHSFSTSEIKALISSIDNLKILDPACGSGAFPMGILHKLVHILHKLDPQNNYWKQKQIEKVEKLISEASQINDISIRENVIYDLEKNKNSIIEAFENNELDYGRKLYLIENCIYGVDIQPIAVQISKLRFFISLIVDQKLNLEKDNYGIRPLPNLETKFVAANTLISLRKETVNLFTNPLVEVKKVELTKVRHEYFEARSPEKKKKCREEDKKLRAELAKLFEDDQNLQPESAKQLANWNPYDQNASSEFFEPEWMFGIFEGFDLVIGNPPYGADIFPLISVYNKLYNDVIYSYGEIYKMFFKLAKSLLKENGTMTYITSNTFLSQPRYHDLRKFLLKLNILKIINLGLNVFSEHVVVPVSISIISNNLSKNDILLADLSVDSKFNGSFNEIAFEAIKLSDIISNKDYSFYNIAEYANLLNTMRFDDIFEIKDGGIQYHRSGIGLKNKGGNDLYERLFSEDVSKFTNSKETWYGRLIDKYYISENTNEYFNMDFKKSLKAKESVSYSPIAFSTKNKILWRQTASKLIATIDNQNKWFRNTIQCCWIKEKYKEQIRLEYALAICNSKLVAHFYNQIVRESGRVFPQIKIKNVKKLPFILTNEKNQIIISIIVKYLLLLNLKKSNISSFFMDLIDAIIYELYFPEEIKTSKCEVIKFLENLPELKKDWTKQKKLSIIEAVYKDLSNENQHVSKAIIKMKEIDVIKKIENCIS